MSELDDGEWHKVTILHDGESEPITIYDTLPEIEDFEYYPWLLSPDEMSKLFNNEITPDELRASHKWTEYKGNIINENNC